MARELVPGDLVTLQMGDRIPADLRLFEAIDLHVDESSFTGETDPRYKHANPMKSPVSNGIEHLDNIVFMGTLVSSGRGRVSNGLCLMHFKRNHFRELSLLLELTQSLAKFLL